MAESSERETVMQNLRDAGCNRVLIKNFMNCYDKEEKEQQIKMLEEHRSKLLYQVHKEEREIFCLDYLLCQIQKA